MATMDTRNTFALSKSLDFRFLTFGDSSKKISEPRAKPRPRKGVSCLLFGVEVTVEVVDGGILLRLRSLSCALSKSEADIRGCFSSSGFSENRGKIVGVLNIYANHPSGNLVLNENLWNLMGRLNDLLRSIPKSAELKKSEKKKCTASKHGLYLLKLPKRNDVNHLILQPEFPPVFPVCSNGSPFNGQTKSSKQTNKKAWIVNGC